jgi:ABC-type branched-subunit amino acid transport system substrate-binding protein
VFKGNKLFVALVGLVLVAGACGSSSKSSASKPTGNSTPTGNSAPTGNLTGTPIKLGVISSIQSPVVSEPYILQAAKIGAAAVNAAGGVMGHKVVIDSCDDQYTPEGAAVCAQKLLVQDKDLMLVGGDGSQDAAIDPTLATMKTINWGDAGASAAALSNPNTYILNPIEAGDWAFPQMLPANVHHITEVIADVAIALQSEKAFESFLPKTIQFSSVSVPLTATSMQATCLGIQRTGAQAVLFGIPPTQVPVALETCATFGLKDVLWTLSQATASPQVVRSVTSLGVPNIVFTYFSGAAESDFTNDVTKYGSQLGGIDNTLVGDSINAWLAVKLVPSLVSGAGSLDPAKIKAWLDQQTAFNTNGATPPLNFTATALPQLPRLKNLCTYEDHIQNNQLVQTTPTPFCVHLP